MPSPFPGMDPFIEGQAWEDFHFRLADTLSDALTARLRPRYFVRVERRLYIEHHPPAGDDLIRPDLTIARPLGRRGNRPVASHAEAGEPIVLTLDLPEEERESYLVIRTREGDEVVTVIEILSPGNKRPGSDGRREYLEKRDSVLRSRTHLVELDLLRGGERLHTREPLPRSDYYAFVSRAGRRPRVEVYFWRLADRLTRIPVPLSAPDPDVPLDLQAALDAVYDRAGYDYSLRYDRPVRPPLSRSETAMVRRALRRRPRPQ